MAVDERAQHELHRRLEEVLGADEAATLMAHLPPVGWADVATKHDLAQLEERLNLRFESIDQRFESVNDHFDSLEDRMNLRFQAMEDRFEGKLDGLRAEFFERMADQSVTFVRATVFSVVGSVLTVASLVFAARLV
jgi:uncharacterized protein YPO0396